VSLELAWLSGPQLDSFARVGTSFGQVIAVEHRVSAGWHVYWRNPGDSGLATTLELERGDGGHLHVGPTLYPAPERLPDPGGGESFGWEGGMVLFVPLPGPRSTEGEIVVRSRWLACRARCIPGTSEARIKRQDPALEPSQTRVDEGRLKRDLGRLPKPGGSRIQAHWRLAEPVGSQLQAHPRGVELELELDAGGGRLDAFFPYDRDRAVFEGSSPGTPERLMRLRYRFVPGEYHSEDGPQGILRWSWAGEVTWFELAATWPSVLPKPGQYE